MKKVMACLVSLALPFPAFALGKTEQAAYAAVKGFYEAANRGECEKAQAFLSAESLKTIGEQLGSAGGFEAFCRDKGGKSPLREVSLVKVQVKKGVAEVVTDRYYKDGSGSQETEHLVNEGGAWRLAFTVR
jgi:hypothetical protein